MCMKYINANVRCYNSIELGNQDNIVAFNNPFNIITANVDKNVVSIGDFVIQTEINAMGTNNAENKKDNPISSGKCLHITLRLTKCDHQPERQICTDIDEFDIDFKKLADEEKLSMACYPFYNYIRVTQINEIILPDFDTGRYVLKLLIRDTTNSEDDTIQTMSPFTVKLPECKTDDSN